MQFYIFLLSLSLVFAQRDNVQDALNNVFNNSLDISSSIGNSDFFNEFELVTQPPLGDLRALVRCGEGEQFERFTCVPYYNCDPDTKTVVVSPVNDGANKIEIRMRAGEDFKCSHYLQVCCELPNNTDTGDRIILPTSRPTESRPTAPTLSPNPSRRPTTPSTGSRPTVPTAIPTAIPTLSRRPQGRNSFCGIRNSQGIDLSLPERTNEALFGEFPWMVAVLRKNPTRGQNLSICGGSLITPRVVLTGAHCVDRININEIKIRVGEWDTQTTNERIPYQERNVVEKIIRYDFIRGNLYNDVALLILDRNLARADNVGTICLPQQDQVLNSKECFATGWGKDKFSQSGQYAVILKKIQLPLVQNKDCERALQKTRLGNSFGLHESFICAGGEAGVDTCTGDGGSPLVCPDPNNPGRYVQAGIVAWGISCGENQVPGVYVDVTKFRQWIDTKLQNLNIGTTSYQ